MTDEQILDKLTLLRMLRFKAFYAMSISLHATTEFDTQACRWFGIPDDKDYFDHISKLANKMSSNLDGPHFSTFFEWHEEATWFKEHADEQEKGK